MLFPALSSLWTFRHASRPHSLSGSPSELQVHGTDQSSPGRVISDALASSVSRRPSPALAVLNGSSLGAGGFATSHAAIPPAPLQRVSVSSSALNAIAGASSPGGNSASPTSVWCRSRSQTSLAQSPANGKPRTPRPTVSRVEDAAASERSWPSRTYAALCDVITRCLPSACVRFVRRSWLDVTAGGARPGGNLRSLQQRVSALMLLLMACLAWIVMAQALRLARDMPFPIIPWSFVDVLAVDDQPLKGMTFQREVRHVAVHACSAALKAAKPQQVALCPVDASHTTCVLAQATFADIVVLPVYTLERRVEEIHRALFGMRVVVVDTDNLLSATSLQKLMRGTTWTAIRGQAGALSTDAATLRTGAVVTMRDRGLADAISDGSIAHAFARNNSDVGVVMRVPEAQSFHLLSSRSGDTPHVALLLTRPPRRDITWSEYVDALIADGVAVRILVPPPSQVPRFAVPPRMLPLLMHMYDEDAEDGTVHAFRHPVPAWQVARRVMHFDALLCLHDCDPSFADAADIALAAGVPVLMLAPDGSSSRQLASSVADPTLGSSLFSWLTMHTSAGPAAVAIRLRSLLQQRAAVGGLLRMASDALQAQTYSRMTQLLQAPAASINGSAHALLASTHAQDVWTEGCLRLRDSVGRQGRANGTIAVAFYSYELSPINSGGAGVVIAALAIEMIARGHTAIVIGHMACDEVDAWARHVIKYLGGDETLSSRFHVHCVWHLVSNGLTSDEIGDIVPAVRQRSEFIRNSAAAAFAMQRTYLLYEYDAIEVFDYNGVGMDILRARADLIAPLATLTLSRTRPYMPSRRAPRSILSKAVARWFKPYMKELWLPLHVPVVVRAHGTIQAIDESETTLADQADRRACYAMEQYAAEAGDVIFAQSHVIRHLYQRVYNLAPSSFVFAPPPMARILDMFTRGAEVDGDDCAHEEAHVPIPCDTAREGAGKCIIALVLGKLQHVKGPETVAAAYAAVSRMLSPAQLDALRLVFVGHDLPCPVHRRPMSHCVHGLLPPEHAHRVYMTHGLSRKCIPHVVRSLAPTFAIMASEFETFNLVAHELAFLQVPLIVSDIPAYREFFNPSNAYVFAAANATSLATQMLTVVDAATRNESLRIARLQYQDPLQPYQGVVTRAVQRCSMPLREAWPATLNHTATFGVPAMGVRHALEQALMRVDSQHLCPVQHP